MGVDEELERIKQMKLRRMIERSRSPPQPPKPKILKLTDSSFDRALASERLLLVDFYADWCGPCKAMEPVFEGLAAQYAGRVAFARLNVDENPTIAGRYGITAIPTFIIFQNARPAGQLVGAVGEHELARLVEGVLD